MIQLIDVRKGFGGAEIFFEQLSRELINQLPHKLTIIDGTVLWRIFPKLLRLKSSSVVLLNVSVLGIGIIPFLYIRLRCHRLIILPHVVTSAKITRPRFWWLRLLNQYIMAKLADNIVAISTGNSETLVENFGARNVELIHNFRPLSIVRRWEPSELNHKQIALIGRLQNKQKGQFDFLIHLGPELLSKGYEIHFFGTGPDESPMAQFIETKGLANVFFHGWCTQSYIAHQPFGIVINSSQWEGLPLSVIESILHGRIVFAKDISGNRELIDAEFRFSDFDELDSLLANFDVSKWIDQLKLQRRRVSKLTDRNKICAKYLALLRRSLDEVD